MVGNFLIDSNLCSILGVLYGREIEECSFTIHQLENLCGSDQENCLADWMLTKQFQLSLENQAENVRCPEDMKQKRHYRKKSSKWNCVLQVKAQVVKKSN